MAAPIGTINPSLDILTIAGHVVTGYADDTKITIERDNDIMNKLVGVNGQYSLAQNLDKTGTMTIRLQETSPSNEFFWAALTAMNLGEVKGVFPFTSVRNGAASSLKGGVCWLQGQPSMDQGSNVAVYEWVFGVDSAASGPAGIVDAIETAQDIAGI
jgi:hypothetical protein